MHGKEFCKQNLHKPAFKSALGNRLDELVRKCQDQQSIGIPIGPDTSRIIGEIIGVGVEGFLASALRNFESRALRYVDDIVVGFDINESAEAVMAAFKGPS
jgi:hypothetical protein